MESVTLEDSFGVVSENYYFLVSAKYHVISVLLEISEFVNKQTLTNKDRFFKPASFGEGLYF